MPALIYIHNILYIWFNSQRLQMSAFGIGDIQSRPFCEQRFAAVVQQGLALQERWAIAASDNIGHTGIGIEIGSGLIQPQRPASVAAAAVAPAGSTAPQATATLATAASANSGWTSTALASAASAIAAPATATAAENPVCSDRQSSESPVVLRRLHKAPKSHGVRGGRPCQRNARQEKITVDSSAAAKTQAKPTNRDTDKGQKRRRKSRW